MKAYITILQAIDPTDNQLKTFSGQIVYGTSFEDAQERCQKNGKGYLKIHGELIQIICE